MCTNVCGINDPRTICGEGSPSVSVLPSDLLASTICVFVHLCVCVFVYDDDAVDDVDDDDHLDDLVVGQDASLLLGNTPLHDLDDKYKIIFSRNSAASLTP